MKRFNLLNVKRWILYVAKLASWILDVIDSFPTDYPRGDEEENKIGTSNENKGVS